LGGKKLAFLTQNKAKLCKNLIITLFLRKNANFFRRKSPKIVIITMTTEQGDQICRILSLWAIVYFGQIIENYFWQVVLVATFYNGKVHVYIFVD
jgi:hypothetical protein